MSRRKQSNPKPLKNELPLGEFSGENEERKDTPSSTWTEPRPPNTPSPTNGNVADATMVTVLDAQPIKSETPPERPRSVAEDDRKSPSKPEQDEKPPRIRLKAALATDPALSMMANVKNEVLEGSPEYLSSLSPAIQTALASRGLLFPGGLNLEAVAAMAVAQRAVASTTPSEPSGSSEGSRASVPIYQCVPCGIRFSSLSTLEAHQTYYCSHRPNKPAEDDPKQQSVCADGTVGQSDADPSDPNAKNVRVNKQYTCMHCSYSADKKVSLNRHMRMHTVSPGPAPATMTGGSGLANGDAAGAPDQDRYCAECDIRFSSQKTFRAHKMHYCNSRHVVKSTAPPSSCTSGSSPTSPVDPATCRTPPSPTASSAPQQHFLALPTNPIIIVPYSLFKSASVLPSLSTATGFPSPDTPCFLMPNGTLQPMTSALTAVSSNSAPQGEQVLKAVNKGKETGNNRESSSAPLDLTVRKSPDPEYSKSGSLNTLDPDQEKENMKHRSPSPERIECEPSIQGSPCSTPSGGCEKGSPGLSHSPKRKLDDLSRSNSPRSSKTPKLSLEKHLRTSPEAVSAAGAAPFEIPPALHPLLLRSGNISALIPPELQMRLSDLAPIPPVMPQVIVKQGVSKCKECNIVFCKHENYLIHKKHYCSSRSADDDASKNSGSPPVSPRSGGTTSPATQYQQLICLACGIKFTSPDNLNAHQQYYCLKRGDTEPKRCAKCRGLFEPGHQCVTHTAVAGWKCPCCDVISATASAAQRHMESHTGVKAYLCNICRYKGNTLRGMKTHIRMHFHKRSPDLQEENYISYILDDDTVVAAGMEISAPPVVVADEVSSSPNLDTRPDPHLCPHCPYSSPYKANVVRHVKLVHECSEEANGEPPRGSIIKEEDEEIIVKKEAMEPEIIIAPVDGVTIKEEPDLSSPKGSDEIVQEVPTKPGAHYCKSCNIYFTYPNSFIAHKKFYCSSHAGEISSSNNNNNTAPRPAEASVL
ncbi:zinc finger protein ush isoform X2 [Anthonomus grandis grandis]|uniref:zinc finger protein ush isoform X2 n=1 Tax=Anthonomus grandis grandis TaxID=2921223 RepID=UPI002164FFD6|nr:zinc finger protein ush isoform X2 [Anthonomus grandis grandis]